MFESIRPDNYIMFAMKHYKNPQGDSEKEFYEDVKRFKYIKRLFRKYKATGELKTRLVINHLIVLQNVFGVDAACTLLFFKIEREFWGILKTFLVYLKYVSDEEFNNVKVNKTILNSLEQM